MSWRRKRPETDFSEELQAHLALETDRLREEVLSEEEAQAKARHSLGNITKGKICVGGERDRAVRLDNRLLSGTNRLLKNPCGLSFRGAGGGEGLS